MKHIDQDGTLPFEPDQSNERMNAVWMRRCIVAAGFCLGSSALPGWAMADASAPPGKVGTASGHVCTIEASRPSRCVPRRVVKADARAESEASERLHPGHAKT
jgi:hypothetical protein